MTVIQVFVWYYIGYVKITVDYRDSDIYLPWHQD